MTIIVTALEQSPGGVGGALSRDIRVRWALEEVGQPYDLKFVSHSARQEQAYRALQPFGQIPVYTDGDLVLFESGSILLHIAQSYPGLLPADPNGRARAVTWMFAAIGSVEPAILELVTAKFIEGNEPWKEQRLPIIEARIHKRLRELAVRLGDAEWLEGRFSAGDLMMVHVLQRLKPSGMIDHHPGLSAYVGRGEARPAYKRAFSAKL